MKIGIAFDLAPTSGPPAEGPDDRFEEFDKPETVEALADVFRGEGHDVVLLGDGRPFLEKVLADPPDFVWNIAEGEGVGRCREARVPAALEMLGIPYSGSDPLTLAACLDKGTTRQMLRGCVRMPEGWSCSPNKLISDQTGARLLQSIHRIFDTGEEGWSLDFARSPVILKPAYEGSSKGIRGLSIATTEAELVEIYRRLACDYRQPIVIEEYIAGEEITVGVCGNVDANGVSTIEILGVMRIIPKQTESRFVYSLEVKRDWANRVSYETPARLAPQTLRHLECTAKLAYANLDCRDFARLDYRVDAEGKVYFIEANPLPGLAPVTSDLVILAEGYGLSHADLIRKLLHISLKRVGLS